MQHLGGWLSIDRRRLPAASRKPAPCFHGGRSIQAVGERFDALDQSARVINADVLDAWFPPAPGVVETLREHLPWLLRTSPPTDCAGMLAAIAGARGVPSPCLLPGAGSSDLIFRAFCHWLKPHSRALILDPTYGEYAHALERVIGCAADRLVLSRDDGYRVDPGHLEAALRRGYDLVVLVNPNSPTGQRIPRRELETILRRAPNHTRLWVDETYIDYAGADESLEGFAARSKNVIVCKSMSKAYALSGARVAYLCAGPGQLEPLRAITPPWAVGLLAQTAAVRALEDPAYYAARYRETHVLRGQLARALGALGWEVAGLDGAAANFLLCHLSEAGPVAAELTHVCERRGLFLRDASGMGSRLGARALRIAVKDAHTQAQMIETIRLGIIASSDKGSVLSC